MPPHATTGRVLVPLDGSERAEAILPLLGAGEHPWGSEVLLVRSLTSESPAGPSAEREAVAYLAVPALMLERAGLRVRCEVWHGDPSQTIVNAADRGRVGLIAMTTHGWRGLDRLRFGSVAESVGRKARVPALLVRGQLRWPADRSPRILVPLDGSGQSTAILALVAKLRRRLHAAVELLHGAGTLPPDPRPARPAHRHAVPLPDRGTERLRNRRVLAVDDRPSLTRGVCRQERLSRRPAASDLLVDPRPYTRDSLRRVFQDYAMLGPGLPARRLQRTADRRSPCHDRRRARRHRSLISPG